MSRTDLPIVLSLGAGVQSSALLFMAAEGRFPEMPSLAVFADTQGESERTNRWVEFISRTKLPFPVWVRSRGSLADAVLTTRIAKDSGNRYLKPSLPFFVDTGESKPGRIHRQCTEDYKIIVVQRAIRDFLGISRGKSYPVARVWLGISKDEVHRMRDSKVSWLINEYPLIDHGITREDCIEFLDERWYNVPRSACVFCPFRSDMEWTKLRESSMGDFLRAVEFEKLVQETHCGTHGSIKGMLYLHRSCRPLGDVDFVELAQDDWSEECTGHCGV